MAGSLSLAIRTLHVLTMAVVVGGSVAVWFRYRRDAASDMTLARQYEWLFWAGLGVLAVTGVGNLGAVGAPGPATAWGRTLLVKLLVVLAFVLGSAVRTLGIIRADDQPRGGDGTPESSNSVARAYGATVIGFLSLVVLAEVLAHG
jgi:uncharacterized membrane protein